MSDRSPNSRSSGVNDETSVQYNGKAQAAISSATAAVLKRSATAHASASGAPQQSHVDEREHEREHERDHRQRRPVAEPQVLQQRREGVERDRLRGRARSAAGQHVDEIEHAERVDRAEHERHRAWRAPAAGA